MLATEHTFDCCGLGSYHDIITNVIYCSHSCCSLRCKKSVFCFWSKDLKTPQMCLMYFPAPSCSCWSGWAPRPSPPSCTSSSSSAWNSTAGASTSAPSCWSSRRWGEEKNRPARPELQPWCSDLCSSAWTVAGAGAGLAQQSFCQWGGRRRTRSRTRTRTGNHSDCFQYPQRCQPAADEPHPEAVEVPHAPVLLQDLRQHEDRGALQYHQRCVNVCVLHRDKKYQNFIHRHQVVHIKNKTIHKKLWNTQ